MTMWKKWFGVVTTLVVFEAVVFAAVLDLNLRVEPQCEQVYGARARLDALASGIEKDPVKRRLAIENLLPEVRTLGIPACGLASIWAARKDPNAHAAP